MHRCECRYICTVYKKLNVSLLSLSLGVNIIFIVHAIFRQRFLHIIFSAPCNSDKREEHKESYLWRAPAKKNDACREKAQASCCGSFCDCCLLVVARRGLFFSRVRHSLALYLTHSMAIWVRLCVCALCRWEKPPCAFLWLQLGAIKRLASESGLRTNGVYSAGWGNGSCK